MYLPEAGELTEVVGARSAGRTSLLLAWCAEVTRGGGIVGLVDADDTLDVAAAERAGVELRRLLWVRCGRRRAVALRAVDALARCRGFALVACDVGDTAPRLPLTAAFRLKLAARQSGSALLIVSPRRITGAAATIALEVRRARERWEGSRPLATRLAGTQARIHIQRSRRGPTGPTREIWELRA